MARLKWLANNKEASWRLLVAEQRRCGLSIRAFCRRKAISEAAFYAWRKELEKLDAERTAEPGSSGRLIPVDVIRSTGENNAAASRDDAKKPLEICTPGGFTLRFAHDTTSETVARLLGVIAHAPTGGTSC